MDWILGKHENCSCCRAKNESGSGVDRTGWAKYTKKSNQLTADRSLQLDLTLSQAVLQDLFVRLPHPVGPCPVKCINLAASTNTNTYRLVRTSLENSWTDEANFCLNCSSGIVRNKVSREKTGKYPRKIGEKLDSLQLSPKFCMYSLLN